MGDDFVIRNFKRAFIDSARRTEGDPENFEIEIDELLLGDRKPQSMKIVDATIPNAAFNVLTNVNDVFKFNNTTIVVPSSYYNATTLANTLQSLLRAEEPSFSVSFNESTQKYTIVRTDGTPFSMDFTVPRAMTGLLGFNAEVYSPQSSFTSDNATTFVASKYIGIVSKLVSGVDNGILIFQDANTYPAADQPYVTTGLLATIPITSCFNSMNFYFANQDKSNYQFIGNSVFAEEDKNRIFHLQLVSLPDGNQINLNGQEWACTIELQFNQ